VQLTVIMTLSACNLSYFQVSLTKPMGVVFEENDPAIGGVFVASLAADGAAATEGTIKVCLENSFSTLQSKQAGNLIFFKASTHCIERRAF